MKKIKVLSALFLYLIAQRVTGQNIAIYSGGSVPQSGIMPDIKAPS